MSHWENLYDSNTKLKKYNLIPKKVGFAVICKFHKLKYGFMGLTEQKYFKCLHCENVSFKKKKKVKFDRSNMF